MLNANTILCINKSTDSPNMPDEIHDHLTMSFTCKGFMSYCLRQQNGWQLRVTDVIAVVIEQKTSIYSIIRKLMALGYITRHQDRLPNGRMGRVFYHIHDTSQLTQKPDTASSSPQVGFPEAVVQSETVYINKNNLLNNNLTNTANCCSNDFVVEETDFFLHDWQGEFESTDSDHAGFVAAVVSEEVDISPSVVADEQHTLELQCAPEVVTDEAYAASPIIEVEKTTDVFKLWPCNDAVTKSHALLKHCLSKEVAVELALGAALTPNQLAVVKDVAHFFAVRNGEKELAEWIELSLISPLAFNNCKTFLHKLNSIIKKIKDRSFTRPRYSASGPDKPRLPKNMLAAAHSVLAGYVGGAVKDLAATTEEAVLLRSLQNKKRLLLQQLASCKSAEVQFKKFPDVARQHAQSKAECEKALLALDERFQKLSSSQNQLSQRNCNV